MARNCRDTSRPVAHSGAGGSGAHHVKLEAAGLALPEVTEPDVLDNDEGWWHTATRSAGSEEH
ncbi:hypothetical protein CAOG_010210 [Capsaspora owczarzaki ATCC 30864]|uniref:Uncharacterized protein n=1 Tax=Capsaspora owczarzaki (strain ATCC 30864) TaxID=595528 RepID=A0A0D2WY65_CAPO3|nr:hypothetical protein CAOG_010210 [Capsaspora owczarzaki ATCC 30864]